MDILKLEKAAQEVGAPLGPHQLEQLCSFSRMLIEHNARHNLTAITEPEDILIKHMADSLSLVPHIDTPESGRVVDIGTGAGFPGLVLAIAMPSMKFVLLDAQVKRIAFVQAMTVALELDNVEAVQARAEQEGRGRLREGMDIATARAVAPLGVLAEYALPLVRVGGKFLAMKGQRAQEEAEEAAPIIAELGGGPPQIVEVPLPYSDIRHSIVVINKLHPTPSRFPRTTARIKRYSEKHTSN